MPRALPEADDRLLDAKQCAERAHVPVSEWWGIAKSSLALQRARVHFRNRTFWLASGVARWLRSLAGARGEQQRGAAGREALRLRNEARKEKRDTARQEGVA